MEVRHQKAKILIIDDEPANVLLLQRTLQQVGFTEIEPVTDPLQTPALLDKSRPDIILLDLQMPGLDGFGVMQALKKRLTADDYLPVLVLTADATQDTKRKALAQGAHDYLTKPFDLFEVVLRTRNLLTTRFLHSDLQAEKNELEKRVSERTADLEQSQVEILGRLAIASEFRDDETGEHTKRVGNMAALVAKYIGVSESEAEMIRLAAQLHDIGKAGLPDSILLKPGKLTEEEFDAMKAHTTMGAEILGGSNSPLLQMAEQIALTHHEHWNGKGYPNHLSGERIPLAGRIVAVTDVFDALTHARSYKQQWSLPEAVDEIKRLSGQQFDPTIVEALLRVLSAAGLYLAAA